MNEAKNFLKRQNHNDHNCIKYIPTLTWHWKRLKKLQNQKLSIFEKQIMTNHSKTDMVRMIYSYDNIHINVL